MLRSIFLLIPVSRLLLMRLNDAIHNVVAMAHPNAPTIVQWLELSINHKKYL